ncbi:MAG: formylglycine-generating enzyme family protein [Chloroflexi bacterium]|nr:formylglycine-generating enzyme family protein [Chloroflexota bacterium]
MSDTKRPLKVFLCHAHADRDPVPQGDDMRGLPEGTCLTQDGVYKEKHLFAELIFCGGSLWIFNLIIQKRSGRRIIFVALFSAILMLLFISSTISGAEAMVLVPDGIFVMGSDVGDADELPVFTLNLASFYIDKYEVTNIAYQSCVKDGVCGAVPESYEYYREVYHSPIDADFYKYPVVYVDWYMAKTYCEWRNARLPTEAEWEKAARGNDGRIYPWGNEFGSNYVNLSGYSNPEAVGWYEDGKSVYGAYDMAGNVQEWVSSLYMPYPYSLSDGRENMISVDYRVQRGGSWSMMTSFRTSDRTHYYPTHKDHDVGFRCARDANP